MAFSKVTLNGTTLMDVTQDTVEEENLLAGETATKANGVRTTGTLDLPIGVGEPYDGVDLTTKFASEISTAGNAWTWIKSRITAGDYSGLHIGDYIPFTCSDGSSTALSARIIGINTYKYSGGTEIGNHIDFCAGLWPSSTYINGVKYNNGTTESAYPWLASRLYLFANSLSGSIPNSEAANPSMASVDFTSGGIYYYLPSALKNVIVQKYAYLEKRYTAGSLLTSSSGGGWTNIGRIWPPSEVEVYGYPVYGNNPVAIRGTVQYPFFANQMNRSKIGRQSWWLINPFEGDSRYWCNVSSSGYADGYNTTSSYYMPVCFRIA